MAVIVLDASVVIAFLDSSDAHHASAVAALAAHQSEQLVLPASTYAEILVGPYRRGPEAVTIVDRFIADLAIRVIPITEQIARHAAALRSQHAALRLPDALVLATGDLLEASIVLTADAAWPRWHARARKL